MGLPWLWSRLLYLHRGLSGMDKVSQEKSGQGATEDWSGKRRRGLDHCGAGGKLDAQETAMGWIHVPGAKSVWRKLFSQASRTGGWGTAGRQIEWKET